MIKRLLGINSQLFVSLALELVLKGEEHQEDKARKQAKEGKGRTSKEGWIEQLQQEDFVDIRLHV